MTHAFYAIDSLLIAAGLLIFVVAAMATGNWLGRREQASSSEPMKSQYTAVEGSLLGLVSLLLGFSFSISLHHHDSRTEAMLEEANAIGTTFLRAGALPDSVRNETLTTLEKYVDLRVEAGRNSVADDATRAPLLQEAAQLRAKLWDLAMQALKDDDRVTTTGLYIQALNDLVDAYGTRDEIIHRRLPDVSVFLLLLTVVLAAGMLGYTSGVAGHRPSLAAAGFMVMLVIVLTMILDQDRPRRGFVQVNQKNMLELQDEIRRANHP